MSIRNMKSQKRKKYQRAVNRLVRTFNKDIQNDWLWNGRFEISQEWSTFQPFEDHSGVMFTVGLVITDTKTGYKEYNYFDNYNIEWQMWNWANECITSVWDVWKEDPDPNTQARNEGRMPPPWPKG